MVRLSDRLCALITTLISQGFFIGVNKVSMPREKVARVMNGLCLVDMCANEVVKAITSVWNELGWCLGRPLNQALDSLNVVFPLLRRQ